MNIDAAVNDASRRIENQNGASHSIIGVKVSAIHNLKFVAMLGVVDDWAAYVYYRMDDDGDIIPDRYVAENGDKILKEHAEKLFPYLNIDSYRR